MLNRSWLILSAIAIVVILGFGWPTPYRYIERQRNNDESILRVHRLTGQTEVFTGIGWEALVNNDASNPATPVPASEHSLIRMHWTLDDSSPTFTKLAVIGYNGTSYHIHRLTVRLVYVLDANTTTEELYSFHVTALPYSMFSDDTFVFIPPSRRQNWRCEVLEMSGTRGNAVDAAAPPLQLGFADPSVLLMVQKVRAESQELITKAISGRPEALTASERDRLATLVKIAKRRIAAGSGTAQDKALVECADPSPTEKEQP